MRLPANRYGMKAVDRIGSVFLGKLILRMKSLGLSQPALVISDVPCDWVGNGEFWKDPQPIDIPQQIGYTMRQRDGG